MPETTLLGDALPVELLVDGDWRPAVLLGWRHAPDGACRVRVQAVVGGLRRAGWAHLADLRLPQPDRPQLDRPRPGQARRASAPLPPLPVPRSLQPDPSWT